jgi:hypothetical protein
MYLTAKTKEPNSGHACLCTRDAEGIFCLAFSFFQRIQSQQQSSANKPQLQY